MASVSKSFGFLQLPRHTVHYGLFHFAISHTRPKGIWTVCLGPSLSLRARHATPYGYACDRSLRSLPPAGRTESETGIDNEREWNRSRKKPSEVRWMTKRLEHEWSESRWRVTWAVSTCQDSLELQPLDRVILPTSLLLSSPRSASERSEGRGVGKPRGWDTTRDSRTRGEREPRDE